MPLLRDVSMWQASKHTSHPLRPPFPTLLAPGVFGTSCACFKGSCAGVVSTKKLACLRCGLPARLLERRRWLRHGCSAGRMPLLPPFVRRRAGYGLLEPLAHGTRSRCARASEQVSSSSSAVEYLQPQQLRYGIGGRRELYQLWEISTLDITQAVSVTLASLSLNYSHFGVSVRASRSIEYIRFKIDFI